MDDDIVRATRDSREAVEFIISAAAAAAFSSRFATLLQPIPGPDKFLDRQTGECDIRAVRAALECLPKSPTDLARPEIVASLPLRTKILLYDVLFGAGGSTLAIRKVQEPHPAAHGHVHTRFVFDVQVNSPFLRAVRSIRNRRTFEVDSTASLTFKAYHGAPGSAWYSILHHGLLESRDDPANVSTGRAFGDGLYLAERFDIALAFAPPARAVPSPAWPPTLSAVGVFQVVSNGIVRRACNDVTLPEHYVVADEASVQLEEIILLRPHISGTRRGSTSSLLLTLYVLLMLALGSSVSGGWLRKQLGF